MYLYICICLYKGVCLSSRGFLSVFCMERLVWSGSCPSPLSEYIRYNIKLNITFNSKFHMYKKLEKCDVTCSWTPPSVTHCNTFSDPSPLEGDVLYGRLH